MKVFEQLEYPLFIAMKSHSFKKGGILRGFLLLMSLHCVYKCFDATPMQCIVSLSESCSSSLYYVPKKLTSHQETASLFRVDANQVRRTVDGFVIAVNCSCPADHDEFVWHMEYKVQKGDSWEVISSKFGGFILAKPEKQLIVTQTVTLDVLCGCFERVPLVSYRVEAGDTLYTICSRFIANVTQTAQVNGLKNPGLIRGGDIMFIPASGLDRLVLSGTKDSKSQKTSNPRIRIILGSSAAAAAGILLLILVVLWIFCHKKKGREHSGSAFRGTNCVSCCSSLFLSGTKSKQNEVSIFSSEKSTVFSYSEVRDATSNFNPSQKIGQGSYGSVYLGRLRGTEVAIKQMKNTKSKEFLAELNILCKVHHTNLIELIGYAVGGDSLFLVYEFAENGALCDHLHDPTVKGHRSLSWTRRVQIALDAAKGLEYIHLHTKAYYVHRDVKTSNILLDSSFRAKIADFGLVKLLEHSPETGAATSKIVGTLGYLAPEYVRDGCVSTKADVYAYGVVLMELVAGQPALTRIASSENDQYIEHRSLVDSMLSALEDEHDPMILLTKCIDPNLSHYNKDSLLQMALLSKDCVDDDWQRRPDMCQVVLRLSYILARTQKWEGKSLNHPYIDTI